MKALLAYIKSNFLLSLFHASENGGGVGEHTDSTANTGLICAWNNCWSFVVDTNLKTSWAPIDELNSSLCLDVTNSSVNIFWDNITTVQEATSHIFTISWVTFDHLVLGFKASVGNFLNRVRFMTSTV